MCRVAVRCEDGDLVAQRLQSYCGVNDQPLGASDTEIWVNEDDAFLFRFNFCHDLCDYGLYEARYKNDKAEL